MRVDRERIGCKFPGALFLIVNKRSKVSLPDPVCELLKCAKKRVDLMRTQVRSLPSGFEAGLVDELLGSDRR